MNHRNKNISLRLAVSLYYARQISPEKNIDILQAVWAERAPRQKCDLKNRFIPGETAK